MAEYLYEFVTGKAGYFNIGMVAFTIALAWMVRNGVKNGLTGPFTVIALLVTFYASLLGTRLLYVAHHDPGLFLTNPLYTLRFWEGGLSWMGGPFTGVITFMIIAKIHGDPIWSNIGCGAPPLAFAHAFSRIGCVLHGCCYGRPTDVPWRVFAAKAGEGGAYVHPTPIYDMACEIVLAVWLQILWRKPERRKYLMPLCGALSSTHRFITEFYRGEAPGHEIILGLRFYQSIAIFVFAACVSVMLLLWNRRIGVRIVAGIMSFLVAIVVLTALVK